MPRTPTARYLGTIDLRPPRRWRGGDRVRPAPRGPRLGVHGGRAAAGLPVVVRRGRHPRALAGRARQLRVLAGGVVVRVHPPRHDPAVAPRPRRPRRRGPRRVARQPRAPTTSWSRAPRGRTCRCSTAEEGDGIRLRPWRDHDIERPRAARPARPLHARAGRARRRHLPRVAARSGASRCRSARCSAGASPTPTTDAALGEVLVFVTEGTLDDDTAELGYQVVPSGRGRGVATAGARGARRARVRPAKPTGAWGCAGWSPRPPRTTSRATPCSTGSGSRSGGARRRPTCCPTAGPIDALHWELLRD